MKSISFLLAVTSIALLIAISGTVVVGQDVVRDVQKAQQESNRPSKDSQSLKPGVTVRVLEDGRSVIGTPLGWDGKRIALLRRSGEIRLISSKNKDDIKVVADSFEPYGNAEMKKRLQKEFGDRYRVSATKNCVVVHPVGKSEYWAKPFEDFIDGFEDYFEGKKFDLKSNRFPYLIVVLRSRKDFDRYMHNKADFHSRNVVGFYSRVSNRLVTYDPSSMLRVPDKNQRPWLYDSPTVLHETAHQLAFNRGVHNRLSPPPLWLTEGFAMLFEARGIHNAKAFASFEDRINRTRYIALLKLYREKKIAGKLKSLITDDRLFRSEPELAYSLAWSVAFYLAETQTDSFFEYLKADLRRGNFQALTPSQRLKDFATHFGTDFDAMETELMKYYVSEKKKPKSKK